jgi:hypothetical protein
LSKLGVASCFDVAAVAHHVGLVDRRPGP